MLSLSKAVDAGAGFVLRAAALMCLPNVLSTWSQLRFAFLLASMGSKGSPWGRRVGLGAFIRTACSASTTPRTS